MDKTEIERREAWKDTMRCTDKLGATQEEHYALMRDAWNEGLRTGTIRQVQQ